jgi:hypothetical protein
VTTSVWVVGAVCGGLAVAAWYGLLFVVPSCQVSRFRYRLWGLRDRVVDDLISATLPETPPIEELVYEVELAIRQAPDIRLVNFALAWKAAKELPARERAPLTGLSESQRQLVQGYREELYGDIARHLFRGSPPKWLASRALSIFFAAKAFRKDRRNQRSKGGDVVERRVVRELKKNPTLWIPPHREPKEPLSACV